ncbi:Peptidase [hydrothermal vent metagenome]|uniref:Peptidase n=1 Tax=hydrothermal vent metagenome TaxID=652676 RepID=A0A3B0R6M6_9ZZZZ
MKKSNWKIDRWKAVIGSVGLACMAVPAATVYAESTKAEESAFRQAVKFGFSGEAIQGGVLVGDAPIGTRNLSLDGAPIPVDDDGKFIIAFNRDAGQAAQLVATLESGQQIRKFINIVPRKWKIEHVAINRRGRTASTAFKARRGPELAQINAARHMLTDSKGWRQTFIWPVKGRISGMFGNQRIYNGSPGSYHSGMDVAAPKGTYYVAPADGVVTLAASRPFTLEGNLLMIDHGMGLNSAFLHSSEILVKVGQEVKRGEPIGRIGSTGSATGPHLHWSMKWNKARIDPILLTGPMN